MYFLYLFLVTGRSGRPYVYTLLVSDSGSIADIFDTPLRRQPEQVYTAYLNFTSVHSLSPPPRREIIWLWSKPERVWCVVPSAKITKRVQNSLSKGFFFLLEWRDLLFCLAVRVLLRACPDAVADDRCLGAKGVLGMRNLHKNKLPSGL